MEISINNLSVKFSSLEEMCEILNISLASLEKNGKTEPGGFFPKKTKNSNGFKKWNTGARTPEIPQAIEEEIYQIISKEKIKYFIEKTEHGENILVIFENDEIKIWGTYYTFVNNFPYIFIKIKNNVYKKTLEKLNKKMESFVQKEAERIYFK